MKLTNSQINKIKEIYEFGFFMKGVLEYKQDAASNDLSDDDILLLIEAENNIELFTDYEMDSTPCGLCGSHGKVSVKINDKRFVVEEW